ncbi:CUB and peptidase domain-containing protein 2 [Octopus sinensis]|uniref:CUB and peptidase domain-containing protein 2 n=1 Tax=Octopus sinensis TaxID=2607531 RepID=A0A6P7SJR3_9MOLL|nr:CUB and peptidase domain-containing protein 2 [Octopus sinensis]
MLSLCCLLVTVASVYAAPAEQIVGGSPAANCEFPSIVHLTIFNQPTDNMVSLCGGTLIDSTHVLTAAHCLEGHVRKVRVNIGTNDKRIRGPQTTNAIQIMSHEHYVHQPYLIQNDIAILTLSRPVREVGCVKFATMAYPGETFDHKRCIAAGWGNLFFKGNSPNELYKVALPAIPHAVCKRRSRMRIVDGILCAGDFRPGGASTCQGDSGGPLYCPRSNGEMVLAGVTSFGHKCERHISAFSDVGYFRNWIDRHT